MDKEIFEDNMKFEFTFLPKVYIPDSDDNYNIKYNNKNVRILKKFILSKEWDDIIYYLFDEIREYTLPYYTPEMFFVDNILTFISATDNNDIQITIKGILKKYRVSDVKKKYINSIALNKTWSDKVVKMTVDDFYELTADGFYKLTQEGEIDIEGIGQLSLGQDTIMYLKLFK